MRPNILSFLNFKLKLMRKEFTPMQHFRKLYVSGQAMTTHTPT